MTYTKRLSTEGYMNITASGTEKRNRNRGKKDGKGDAKFFTKAVYSPLQDEITNCLMYKC